jgi:hypothetical protein
MAKTGTVTFDNVSSHDPFVVPVACRSITIREQGAAGTTRYQVFAPSATDAGFTKLQGETAVLTAYPPGQLFQTGDIPAYFTVLDVTSATFSFICE